jgi:uncharacterized damage-inducible protein DinB
MQRTDPDTTGPEFTMLAQYLDYHRATLVQKASGLDRAQLNQRTAASGLTLAGLLKHMALVEDAWFQETMAGEAPRQQWAGIDWDADPDWEFRTSADHEPADLLAMYTEACERSRATVARIGDLDAVSPPGRRREEFSLRWVILHLIEETARHNGHADLLREAIDGVTGE